MKIIKKSTVLGEILKPSLMEVQKALTGNSKMKPCFDDESLKAIVYIFQCALMDRMVELYEKEDIPEELRIDMAVKCGNEVRTMVKIYCDVDTFEL